VAIIGGLYWKKGTTAAAWAGMLTGSLLSVGGIIAKQLQGYRLASWGKHLYLDHVGFFSSQVFSLGYPIRSLYFYLISFNGTQIAFGTMLVAVTVYVVVSLLTCRGDFNMDRMLHRGAYALAEEGIPKPAARALRKGIDWGGLIGYDENFTRADKWIAGSLFAWSMLLAGVEIVGSALYLLHPWPIGGWAAYWYFYVIFIPAIFAVIMAVWFTWGGITDAKVLFRKLSGERIDARDDGSVLNHQNQDELPVRPFEPSAGKETRSSVSPIDVS
jgi:SSS family solute:Na+ symporter